MIVYGDPQFTATLHDCLGLLDRSLRDTNSSDVGSVRRLLVQAGQLEQAVADHAGSAPPFEALTDCVADALLLLKSGHSTPGLIREVTQRLAQARGHQDAALTVKIPEGFEFYALYPEQYATAAQKWAEDHLRTEQGSVAVVGLRSIGTTLSALVAAVLRRLGYPVQRCTVRPTGHPYQREVVLAHGHSGAKLFNDASCALVVDEGPGLSGSSMAATAEALAGCGISRIFFLPGNSNPPGASASGKVRRWWSEVPRYFAPMAAGPSGADLSGGLWRRVAFASEQDWPPVAGPFERLKFRSSCGRRLWKFAGLGAWLNEEGRTGWDLARETDQLAARGWTAPMAGVANGFVELPWLEGTRLTAQDVDGDLATALGRYIAAASLPPLAERDHAGGVERLANMLYWNTKEAVGEAAAKRACRTARAALALRPHRAYGDGRLAPWEWIQTPDGRLLKTDCFGHTHDHTLIGPQDILWDVAGAMVEWNLDDQSAAPLFAALRAAGIIVSTDALVFYRLAYAAFRAGLVQVCAESLVEDSLDRARAWAARARYVDQIKCLLP